MTIEHATLCINCLHRHTCLTPCPRCGYNEHHYKHHPLYLKPRTLLENQYILGKTLGQGGFGVTYIGLDKWLQKKVAIKEYLPATLATRDFQTAHIIPLREQEQAFSQGLQSFIREARNLARFNHPHIVKVLNFFKSHQTGYMVMEYLAGTSPATRLSVTDALAILLPILDALAEIHAQQIYHCDISIHNIRVTEAGTPILIDFGAVRQKVSEYSHSLALVLKHGYAPLEQYSGQGNIGPWTDIYACGALLYLLITGMLPPAATDRLNKDTLVAPITIAEQIPPTLNDAIMCALALEPAQRFQSVHTFKAALQGQSPPIQLTSPVATPTPKRKNRKLTTLGLLLIGTGVLFAAPDWFFDALEKFFSPQTVEQTELIVMAEKLTDIVPQPAINHELRSLTQAEGGTTENDLDLQKIAQHYEQVARTAQTQGHLALSLDITEQGLKVIPTHAQLRALQQQLQIQIAQKERIVQLLEQAGRYLTTHQLKAAHQTYQTVLHMDAQQIVARRGLQAVAEAYVQQAQYKKLPEESLTLVNEGLTLFPQHDGLHALKVELITALAHQQQIDNLLKTAEKYRLALRLTEPPRTNAYETYQKVLTLAPAHPQAISGLNKIADQYAQLAHAETTDGERKRRFIEKGLNISPTHSDLLALKRQLLVPPQRPAPTTVVQTVQSVTPPPVEVTQINTKVAQINTTSDLLTTAQQYADADRLEDAVQIYENILTIHPHHPQAMQALQAIATHYEQLARQQQQQANFSASLLLVTSGLAIYPEHRGLIRLREELTLQSARKSIPKTSETRVSPIIFTPTF